MDVDYGRCADLVEQARRNASHARWVREKNEAAHAVLVGRPRNMM